MDLIMNDRDVVQLSRGLFYVKNVAGYRKAYNLYFGVTTDEEMAERFQKEPGTFPIIINLKHSTCGNNFPCVEIVHSEQLLQRIATFDPAFYMRAYQATGQPMVVSRTFDILPSKSTVKTHVSNQPHHPRD